MYQFIREIFYFTLLKTNKTLNESYSIWYHIRKNTLLNGHLILKNIRSTEHIDQRSVRLFYWRLDQGYQNLDKILASREEIQIFSRNINNPVNIIFFSRGSEILHKFFQRKKHIKYQEQLLLAYEKNLKLFEETKKKNKQKKKLIEEKKKSVLSDLHTVRQGWRGKSHLCW